MAAVVLLRVGGEAGQLRGLQRPPRPAHGRQVRVGEGGAGEVLGELLQLLEHGVRTPPPEHRAPPPHAQLLGQRACSVIEIFFSCSIILSTVGVEMFAVGALLAMGGVSLRGESEGAVVRAGEDLAEVELLGIVPDDEERLHVSLQGEHSTVQ